MGNLQSPAGYQQPLHCTSLILRCTLSKFEWKVEMFTGHALTTNVTFSCEANNLISLKKRKLNFPTFKRQLYEFSETENEHREENAALCEAALKKLRKAPALAATV